MLEAEGIVFEEKDGVCKIRQEFFVTGACNSDVTISSGGGSRGESKKRKLAQVSTGEHEHSTKRNGADDNQSSDHLLQESLKQEILSLLEKRLPGKTC